MAIFYESHKIFVFGSSVWSSTWRIFNFSNQTTQSNKLLSLSAFLGTFEVLTLNFYFLVIILMSFVSIKTWFQRDFYPCGKRYNNRMGTSAVSSKIRGTPVNPSTAIKTDFVSIRINIRKYCITITANWHFSGEFEREEREKIETTIFSACRNRK